MQGRALWGHSPKNACRGETHISTRKCRKIRPVNNDLELREFFLLVFLRHLSQRFAGKKWAVRGASCMRFFHRSPRIPEEIELDAEPRMNPASIKEAVETVLENKVFATVISTKGIKSIKVSPAAKNAAAISWKVIINTVNGRHITTGIEVGFRKKAPAFSTGAPALTILERHAFQPFSAQFYGADEMAAQSISALVGAKRNASRYLFDLDRLFNSARVKPEMAAKLAVVKDIKPALGRVGTFTYSDFRKVLPFLDGDLLRLYTDPRTFGEIKSRVGKAISRMVV